jgi:glycosyltransferase involved in cell wall biosynthesis
MRIAFIADGRAEHIRRWVRYFTNTGDDLLLVSTYACSEIPGVKVTVLPGLIRSGDTLVKSSNAGASVECSGILSSMIRAGLRSSVQTVWQQLKIVDVARQAQTARKILSEFKPDLVQASRLQNEGYVAALAGHHPWILSIWGQDFVFYASSYPLHRLLSTWTMKYPDALMADCRRDILLARQAGFDAHLPTREVPGNGGVDGAAYGPGLYACERERLVVYPRGLVPYVRLDTLLESIKLFKMDYRTKFVLLIQPRLVETVQKMVDERSLPRGQVTVMPYLAQGELASLLGRAAVMVSPGVTDGTPNSMLEAMACGAFPVMGDIESVREWITHGRNGLLFDVSDPGALAYCLGEALDNVELRREAQAANSEMIRRRASYDEVMPRVREFYNEVISGSVKEPNRRMVEATELR